MSEPTSRARFEKWISSPPTERDISRFPQDETKSAWPGHYKDIVTQLSWEAWEEGIAQNEIRT